MRQPLICLTVPAVYTLIAYTIGVPLPPQPWLTFCILLALEVPLLYYNLPIVKFLMGSGTMQPEYDKDTNAAIRALEIVKNRMIYLTGVILCSGFVLVASLCCQDGTWSGTHGETQTCIAFYTGMFHMIGPLFAFIFLCDEIGSKERKVKYHLGRPQRQPEAVPLAVVKSAPDLEAGVDAKR
ncbi:hypothetical protein FFLO_03530 [Filobasidium floriforme]|uniref:Uncharacterized protein n=1 Tax=Filobasidium floriforme TaxID=5210 RepID=A0A8K0JKZ7_9TREE|nr:uncharacterized protein HD553DRAFT_37064 [Filobasidium floriforme]KAG7536010.1 hypothetical protein FFLO_03530 [Filobasidium floriforme]KAH8084841.1 hypothetical protein HD553DRAFT_37064 [Filobasidium floriforme]